MYNRNINKLTAVIQSPIAPGSTNVLWDDLVSNTLKVYRKGIWTVIGGAGGGGEGSSLYWGYDEIQGVIFPLEQRSVQINGDLTVNGDITARNLSIKSLEINGEPFEQYWELDSSTNTLSTTYQVLIKNNLIVEQDTSSGGEGEDTPSAGLDETRLQEYLDEHKYVTEDDIEGLIPSNVATVDYVDSKFNSIDLSSYAKTTELNALANKVVPIETWMDNVGQHITYDAKLDAIIINHNLIVTKDTSSGGEGEDTPASGIRGIYVNGTPYTDTDGDGFIDLGTISGGGSADLTNYYTKGESDARYLARSGGRMTGTILVGDYTAFGQTGGNFYLGTPVYPLLLRSNGTTTINGNTLIHSGNIGSYKAGGLATPRTIWGQSFDGTGDVGGSLTGTNFLLMDRASNPYLKFTESGLNGFIQFSGGTIAIGPTFTNSLLVNNNGNVLIGTSTDSGAKLHVEGRIRMRSVMLSHVSDDFATSGSYLLQYYTPSNKLLALTSRSGSSSAFKNYIFTSDWSNGHIGLCDVPSSDYSVYVTGSLGITGAVTMSSTLSVTTSVTTPLLKASGGLDIVANNSGVGSRLMLSTNCFRPWSYDAGLIDLGSSNAQWRNVYAVNGIFSGDTSSGSDIRFKDIIKEKTLKIEDIAKAPLFTFKWNDRDDDTVHLGSSAQYWEKVCPWLVTGEDFKSLNYATLGVAMGISLAKKVKELEAEIKRLKEEMRYGDR